MRMDMDMLAAPKKIVDGLTEVFQGFARMFEGVSEQLALLAASAAEDEDKLLPVGTTLPTDKPLPADVSAKGVTVPRPRKKPVKRQKVPEAEPVSDTSSEEAPDPVEGDAQDDTSVYAEEGTAAHALGEYKLRKYLHERVQRPTSEFDSEEMEGNTDIYAEFIISLIERIMETCPHPLVMVEERLDYSYLVPDGFGTGDCVIIADGTLYVNDYKNGQGIFVSCDHNPQMMLYALGAYHAYGYLYDIQKVSMTIIQPRLENISTFECTVDELLDWGESYVRSRAKLAFEGKGEQVPGDWCRFCRARCACRACAEEALALVKEEFLDLDAGVLVDESEETDATASFNPDTSAPTFKSPALLDKADIEQMLPTLNRIESWIEAIFAYVSSEAINHGVTWAGYKVVEGRSKRQFLDTKSVVAAAQKAGYTDIYKTELISLTEFEKLMGKKKFQEILGEYVVKPPGKLALVPDSDSREAVDLQTAADEFEALD